MQNAGSGQPPPVWCTEGLFSPPIVEPARTSLRVARDPLGAAAHQRIAVFRVLWLRRMSGRIIPLPLRLRDNSIWIWIEWMREITSTHPNS